jgi:sulfate transport system permease protein
MPPLEHTRPEAWAFDQAPPHVSPRMLTFGRFVVVTIVLAYLGLVLLGPIAALVIETLKVGVGNACAAVLRPGALAALRMSLVLVVIAVVVNALVGTAGALALVRHRFVGRAWLGVVCDLPLAVPPVMTGLAFILLVGRGGLLTPLLDDVGVKVVFAFPGLVIGTLFVTLPYTIREVAYVLQEIGTSEEEAATTLGANPWQTFWRVTLPNIRTALAYGTLMTAARALGEFGAVLVLGGSISGQTQTATTFIHDAIEERDVAGAYGMALVLAAMSVVLLLAIEWAKTRHNRATQRGTPA